MTISSYQLRGDECGDECAFLALREMVPDYVAGMLSAPAAEALEDHLLDCRPCRENYLEYLKLLGSAFAALSKFAARGEARAGGGTKVVRLEEFKRRML